MTNGEKFKEAFSITQVDSCDLNVYAWLPNHDAIEIPMEWWNTEYKELKTGHWISYWEEESRCHVYKCPECGNKQPFDTKHCWECGTRLVELPESKKINCKATQCQNCINHNYCDFESQESEVKK